MAKTVVGWTGSDHGTGALRAGRMRRGGVPSRSSLRRSEGLLRACCRANRTVGGVVPVCHFYHKSESAYSF